MKTGRVFIILILSFLCMASYGRAQVSYTQADSLIFEKCLKTLSGGHNKPLPQIVTEAALFFRDTPYVAATLEVNSPDEKLVVNLREMDCTTFVENCIALAQTIKAEKTGFSDFCNFLRRLRYRNGEITDYASRLHYSSDWIWENTQQGIFKDISRQLGGTPLRRHINFMSTHADKYEQLRKSEYLIEKIKKQEEILNKRGTSYVIEKQGVLKSEKQIENGDIILFSTSIKGLDFTHMGIAYRDGDKLTFLHASSRAGKVIIEKHTLRQYCNTSKTCNGLVVLRLNNND
ncbi:hypothetical protein M2132_002004 [Dysgonomonas sp. PH5-45]|uniref:N-acetylmuramoyl-L-alanine amidase-like domain-containing protein n=1 Tax=unclassified Dysgonomonas TaxID=2630389 RepID=UPI002475C2D5|nr:MULTISPECIES: N-acetylmuramoyl-L-alanine amidase-like domain-containing protein [unclassified Dysgonomonas]MDH6355659.1 hypothetical protein [Dysgonomonas sp. PH5-45]MDH6388558.1 hypothetical protein [Dysgonomonas sp. PH5-37]